MFSSISIDEEVIKITDLVHQSKPFPKMNPRMIYPFSIRYCQSSYFLQTYAPYSQPNLHHTDVMFLCIKESQPEEYGQISPNSSELLANHFKVHALKLYQSKYLLITEKTHDRAQFNRTVQSHHLCKIVTKLF